MNTIDYAYGFFCTIMGVGLCYFLWVRGWIRELTEERDNARRWRDAWRNMAGDFLEDKKEAARQIAVLKQQVGTPQWPICIHCGRAMELGYEMRPKGHSWHCANPHCPYCTEQGRQWSIAVYPPRDY